MVLKKKVFNVVWSWTFLLWLQLVHNKIQISPTKISSNSMQYRSNITKSLFVSRKMLLLKESLLLLLLCNVRTLVRGADSLPPPNSILPTPFILGCGLLKRTSCYPICRTSICLCWDIICPKQPLSFVYKGPIDSLLLQGKKCIKICFGQGSARLCRYYCWISKSWQIVNLTG